MSHLEGVVVIGSSGSGKTTVARALATSLDAPHLNDGSWSHAAVHRLRTLREVDAFLESLSAGGADPVAN